MNPALLFHPPERPSPPPAGAWLPPTDGPGPIRALNAALDRAARPEALNEEALVGCLTALQALDPSLHGGACWLSAVRLAELTLWCAGAYADRGEATAAGDLLVNPRRILIHDRRRGRTVCKWRHGRLSDQVPEGAVALETVEPPLLPLLARLLENSGRIRRWYLERVQTRMRQVADTLGFLAAWSLNSMEDCHRRRRRMPPSQLAWFESHLCRFDLALFNRIGRRLAGDADVPALHLLVPGETAPDLTIRRSEDLVAL